MTLLSDITANISGIMAQSWDIVQDTSVPSDKDVTMTGRAVKLEGTVLYADMRQSSFLAEEVSQRVAGKVYQAFLSSIGKLISANEGTITAYDGDRIMGIFVGSTKNTSAARCALQINHLVSKELRPRLSEQFTSLKTAGFEISHCVGIDSSSFLAVKAGQRNANDIVWIGRAPNFAASLSEVRIENYNSFISEDVFNAMQESSKYSNGDKKPMWKAFSHKYLGQDLMVYGSNWTWKF